MPTDPPSAPNPLFAGGGEVGRVMESHDWAATPVGPPETWPPELRSVVRILLTSRFSMWMGWGPDLAFFYNDAYQRDTLRAKHPWALGRPAHEVWAEIWDDVSPRVRQVIETGEATWDEGLLLTLERAGYVEESYHTFSYSPLEYADGRISGLLCVVSENTERVLSERRLRVLSELGDVSTATAPSVEEACRAVLTALERGRLDVPFASVYLLDGAGTAHRTAYFGMLDDPRIVPPVLDDGSPLWSVLQTGEARALTGLAAEHKGLFLPTGYIDDAIEPDAAICMPLVGGGTGRPIGVFTAGVSPFRALDTEYRRFLDLVAGQVTIAVTDAQAYQAQRRRADELAELDRAKTEFFTGVSHELRTPLTLVAGPAEDALADRDHPLTPPQRARLEVIRRSSGRLRRLVDTLLDFARLEGGRLAPQLASVDLAALTRGIAESFAPAATRAGLGFVVTCPALPSAVAVDVDMWEKIVLNLLSNAVKYTLAGGVSVTLAATDDGGVRLDVTDTGIGIPAEDVPLLFQRFHRVQGAAGRSREGSGIGLALVAELTALHGGTTGVASVPDSGSEFSVTLPASAFTGAPPTSARVSVATQRYREEALQWSTYDTDELVPLDAGTTAGDTVLVAEDNSDLRRFLAGLLSPHYRVLVVGDGDSALATALAERPDLVLTDAMMPGLDGFELLTALRADPATATTPVVMLSARAGEDAAIEGLAAGADDYLVKPFSSADLLARVRSNLQLSRVRNQESAWRTALIDAMREGLFVVAPDGSVIDANAALETILGYGRDGLPYRPPYPWLPDPETDPEAAAEAAAAFATATGQGTGTFVLPVRHKDGHWLWVEVSVATAPGRDGGDPMLLSTVRDVTERRRIAERDRLLADTGRLLGQPGALRERLAGLLAAASPVLGDLAVVYLARPDGTHAVAAAHHRDPVVADAVRALPPGRPTPAQNARQRAGQAYELTELSPGTPTEAGGARFGGALVVPLLVAGRLLGELVFAATGRPHRHDDTDVATAEELGRRVALMIETDRLATRERQLHEVTAALAAAGTVTEAARVLEAGIVDATGAVAVSVTLPAPGGPAMVHEVGDPHAVPPVTDAIRTATPGWGPCGAALPLTVGERVVGALAIGFDGPRAFNDDERTFLQTLASEAGLAFERAALADTRRELADTLQRSLLPPALPDHDRVTLAARYLPASSGSNTGGDWYDVLPLDDHHVAIVVGDVVGQGPTAAAVMGQLRSALSAYLLQNHAPAEALTWLNRWSFRVPGARASTAICVVLDTRTGDVRWARAGHPPPLVLGPDGGFEFLEDAHGAVLGVTGAPPFTEGSTTLAPGSTVILYTDGLVERRGEIVDDGVARLAAAAARYCTSPVEKLVPAVLDAALDRAGPADDVALIVARLRPPALAGRGPARPDQLAVVRRDVAAWVTAAALSKDTGDDLQLALGEALANAVEHAYRDRAPGEYHYRLDQRPDGAVQVEVSDHGSWRPPPADPGYRGRGLLVIDRLAGGAVIERSDEGTRVTFTVLPVDEPDPAPAAAPAGPAPPAWAGLRVHDGPRLELAGELDVATVPGLRDRVLEAIHGAGSPVVVDATAVTHLASAGIGLLLEIAALAPRGVRVVVTGGGPVARVLALTDLGRALGAELT
ncbi:SpoIIE family protein phosphatase [Pseudonocardia abyssalis]|uniref:SpoIIE family protein phosphatase n=1 Tax=Pseudonocardia abyssalis TaxID=2792008 RepID=A0ABS6UQX6_9PSEU|nr:SpoIIE family protein phosphatase [Pseudonocardia abyssalis]MBW0115391.1 SpoIIE family protein phosphatase [Pseudonocardia abyssalis]MBW0134649.1 SpoIIE family protein phosphatase [Pseudonocardia abyssalis]